MKRPPSIESHRHRPWTSPVPPRKILAIRFHALGDVVITLPYLQALKNALPEAELHVVTREECADIPRHAMMFAKVFALDDRRNAALLLAKAAGLIPRLRREGYDAVLDLQRNAASRLIRRALMPKGFSEFDRYSSHSAGDRVRRTIDALGVAAASGVLPLLEFRPPAMDNEKWSAAGYSRNDRFIILNPAGSAPSKNWPVESYARFARLWTGTMDHDARFLLLGTGRLAEQAAYLKREVGDRVIDLVNATTAAEAFMLVRTARFMLSEDSALMHMAWISRVPLVALFGSTPAVWSRPLGETSICLNSSDLACGSCNAPLCRFGDVRCLTRYSPEFVLDAARTLISRPAPRHEGQDAS